MQANSAKSSEPLTVSIVTYDRVKLLDVTGPLQVFSDARHRDGTIAYEVALLSVGGGEVSTDTMLPISTKTLAEVPDADTLVIAGGRSALSERYSPDLLALIHEASRPSRRVCSVCLGAFILAEAGFLGGKRATTHWTECHALSEDYPDITVMGDEIFVRDGPVWTSAGVTAGIDMALALVEEDLGRKEALRIARSLVLPIKRQGGQSQFSATLRHQVEGSTGRFDTLLAAIHERPADSYTVPTMAARVHMSERHFSRVFRAEFGVSPAQYVEQIRVEAARDAMLDYSLALKIAAARFGFGTEETMRRAFKRQFGVTPSDMVAQFQSG